MTQEKGEDDPALIYETGNNDQDSLQPRHDQPVDAHIPAPYVFAVPLVAGILLNKWISWKIMPNGVVGDAIGWSLIAGALLLILWTRSTMASFGESIFSRDPTNTLVTTGPYRFSRNPIYAAYAMIYIGTAFNVNTIWPIVALPAVLIFFNRRVISYEERYLERLFGDEYLRYRAHVRRWL